MTIDELLRETESKMKKSVEATRHEFTLIRTGRANPAMLEPIVVTAYGAEMGLAQLASITVPDPRQLLITPFDKNTLSAIEKAIQKSDLNLTPNSDGIAIRLNIPPLNEERRKELTKQLHKKAEHGLAAIRNVRHDCNNHLRNLTKNREIGEDDEKRALDKVQKMTDRHSAEIDAAAKAKERELLEV
ncbi:MAG TPA: ribosome recycling factor [Chthonomonadales bacterium]|nr:ribosome recycling factor [Chthonomonadales bacterium]